LAVEQDRKKLERNWSHICCAITIVVASLLVFVLNLNL